MFQIFTPGCHFNGVVPYLDTTMHFFAYSPGPTAEGLSLLSHWFQVPLTASTDAGHSTQHKAWRGEKWNHAAPWITLQEQVLAQWIWNPWKPTSGNVCLPIFGLVLNCWPDSLLWAWLLVFDLLSHTDHRGLCPQLISSRSGYLPSCFLVPEIT